MITDLIQNASAYYRLSPRIQQALEFLSRPNLADVPLGRHSLDGDDLYINVQEYETRSQQMCFWEAHQKYIDVQTLVFGVETMGYASIHQMRVSQPYSAERDMAIFLGRGQTLEVQPGRFVIFMPQDVHMPCIAGTTAQKVRKIVVKAAVE